jgi:HD superfamily phosphohydrolase
LQTTKIFTDPIYRVMSFGSDTKFIECFKAVMDTKVFQRLRRISQLGLASYVFPGATHNRFSHCLGSAHLARIVLFHLMERKPIPEITEAEFNSVVFGAMLHDLGHGPFSHSFERILKGRVYEAKHEDWTKLLISHEQSEIRRCLEEHGMEVDAICSVFDEASETALRRPLKQIVSSQLDVDRMGLLGPRLAFCGYLRRAV